MRISDWSSDVCSSDLWTDGPLPGPPVTVGIDGGYVRSWYDRPNNFEVIVGKSVVDPGEDGEISEPTRRFGFVVGHDDRPRRRLHELLLEQGVGMDREVTFMSDGGRNVSNLQWDLDRKRAWKGKRVAISGELGGHQ